MNKARPRRCRLVSFPLQRPTIRRSATSQPLTENDPSGFRTRDLRIKRKAGIHTARSPEYPEVCASSHLNARRCSLAVLRVPLRYSHVARQMGCKAGAIETPRISTASAFCARPVVLRLLDSENVPHEKCLGELGSTTRCYSMEEKPLE